MKQYTKYIPWAIIVVLALLLWLKGCEKASEKVITTPEIKGTMPTVNNPVPLPLPAGAPKPVIKWQTVEIEVENPVNQEYITRYQQAKDSLERFKLYADAIGEREYNIPLEDSALITNNYIKARGEVLKFEQSYIIKPQKVPVKQKETVLRVLGGFEIGNTLQMDNFSAKANLMLQNRKGNIFSAGYDTNDVIYVGYNFSIFNIKK